MPKYKVLAELTPFFDIWGDNHWRCIRKTNWFVLAWITSVNHISMHRHGTAHILKWI